MSPGVSAQIPDKQYFKIGEVTRIIGVKAHVLRYWESEFSVLRPDKSPTNQRLYSREDVQTLVLIKRLLYQEGYTISGANRRLKDLGRKRQALPEEPLALLERIGDDLRDLLDLTEEDG